jgi:hypothetical protein
MEMEKRMAEPEPVTELSAFSSVDAIQRGFGVDSV